MVAAEAVAPTDEVDGLIDVAERPRSVSVEALSEAAEGYMQRMRSNPDPLLAKPMANVIEAPELLISFGTLLRGLKPLPGARVLDFGAGTCWTSWAGCSCRVAWRASPSRARTTRAWRNRSSRCATTAWSKMTW
jgi:hypothetical protein